jgi:phi13 family phage major tail protein
LAQVGLNDLHFAVLTEDTKGVLTYGIPEPMVGAINATINPTVNTQELYADDQLWGSISALGKIDVEIETADLPLPIRAKVLGNKIVDGVLIENKEDIPPHIALGFKSLKSNGNRQVNPNHRYRKHWPQ